MSQRKYNRRYDVPVHNIQHKILLDESNTLEAVDRLVEHFSIPRSMYALQKFMVNLKAHRNMLANAFLCQQWSIVLFELVVPFSCSSCFRMAQCSSLD